MKGVRYILAARTVCGNICGFNNTEELLKDKVTMDSKDIPTIEPKFFMKDGKMIGLLPGDPGYDEH